MTVVVQAELDCDVSRAGPVVGRRVEKACNNANRKAEGEGNIGQKRMRTIRGGGELEGSRI